MSVRCWLRTFKAVGRRHLPKEISRWSRDERELFYLASDNTLMAAAVNGQGPAFQVGTVRPVFERPLPVFRGGAYGYDVSGDGKRFLVFTNAPLEAAQESVTLTMVMNWIAGVKK